MSSPAGAAQTSPLLRLPAEVRVNIYEQLFSMLHLPSATKNSLAPFPGEDIDSKAWERAFRKNQEHVEAYAAAFDQALHDVVGLLGTNELINHEALPIFLATLDEIDEEFRKKRFPAFKRIGNVYEKGRYEMVFFNVQIYPILHEKIEQIKNFMG